MAEGYGLAGDNMLWGSLTPMFQGFPISNVLHTLLQTRSCFPRPLSTPVAFNSIVGLHCRRHAVFVLGNAHAGVLCS